MVLHGEVYDITSILDSHPGGAEVLLESAGSDSSIAFDEVGHSQDSYEMLKPFLVGIVDDTDDFIFQRASLPAKRVENSSIGESRFKRQMRLKKLKDVRDEMHVLLLTVLAIFAALIYFWLARRRWAS